MPDPTTEKLLDRIEVLENALKRIARISLVRYEKVEADFHSIDEIATKALWPT